MPVFFIYLIKLSAALALVFLFYQLILRRLTFYNWNRHYLLVYTLLSFFIAFINIAPVLQKNTWTASTIAQWMPLIEIKTSDNTVVNTTSSLTLWNLIAVIAATGALVLLLRLLIQLIAFRKMIRKAPFMWEGGMKFYQVDENITPFSFGNSIFINKDLHTEEELHKIMRHEFVHVKQRHSIDIIWAEVLCILNWYNPFVWLLKNAIRQNLEFIADQQVLENGINKKQYQYLLLKVIGNNQYSIAPKFNFSSLKKRIVMMNKSKSARLHLVRFLFIVPLLGVLLVAFRNRGSENQIIAENKTGLLAKPKPVLSVMPVPVADTTPVAKMSPDPEGTNEKNISVISDEYEITDKKAVIHLHNGTTEQYDLKNKEERKKFEDKYGKIITVTASTTPTAVVSVASSQRVTTTIAPVTTVNASMEASVSSSIKVSPVTVSASVVSPVAISGEAVAVIDDYSPTITGDEDILVSITKATTVEQLEDFKKQMKEKGIDLNFDKPNFNSKGLLTHISGTMKSEDSSSKFSATDFKEVILAMIKEGKRIYFKVIVKENKKVVI